MVAIYSGVTKTENKLEISRFFHAIHNGHHVSRTYDPYRFQSLSDDERLYARKAACTRDNEAWVTMLGK